MGSEGLRGSLRRRVPGIAWRDELLAARAEEVSALRRELRAAQRRLVALEKPEASASPRSSRPQAGATPERTSTPSFRRRIHDLRRGVEDLRALDPEAAHPLLQVARKLRNHRLAASHGVRTPRVLAVWEGADQLDLDGLPDEFVLKSDGGAGGRGVLPLRRLGPDSFGPVGGGPEDVLTREQIVGRYRAARSVEGPVFAEELLRRPGREGLPDDIKIYTFYGKVGQVLLRRMPVHADLRAARYRFLDGTGEDLGPRASLTHRIDPAILPPEQLETYLDVARHLSRAMALPFVRVDLYETGDGPVFGELTRGPGGPQRYRPDHDEAMGLMWEQAQRRLDLDVVAGRPLANLHGNRPTTSLYPVGHPSVAARWPVVTAPCEQWCLR
jgi:hypothetical protein